MKTLKVFSFVNLKFYLYKYSVPQSRVTLIKSLRPTLASHTIKTKKEKIKIGGKLICIKPKRRKKKANSAKNSKVSSNKSK